MPDKVRFILKLFLIALLFLLLDRAVNLVLRTGLDRYYGLDRGAEVLCIGHSHTMLGIDRAKLEQSLGVPVAKYAVNGANVFDRLAMIRHYFSLHPHSVKIVVYDVDDHLLNYDGLSANSYKLFYPYLDIPAIAEYIQSNAGSRKEVMARRLITTLRYNSLIINLAIRGLFGRDDNLKGGVVDPVALSKEIQSGGRPSVQIEQEAVRCLEETIRVVCSHGARLVLCYIPTVDLINNMDPFKHQQVLNLFEKYSRQTEGVEFIDYNPRYSQRHELFADPVHLNGAGRKLVTADLAHDLAKFVTGGKHLANKSMRVQSGN